MSPNTQSMTPLRESDHLKNPIIEGVVKSMKVDYESTLTAQIVSE